MMLRVKNLPGMKSKLSFFQILKETQVDLGVIGDFL